jgi:hypothetical protein
MQIDEFFTNAKGKFTYPLLYVKNASDALAVFIKNVPIGTLPIVIDYADKCVQVGKLTYSAPILKRFCKLFEVYVFTAEKIFTRVHTLYDFVEHTDITLESIYGSD